MNNDILDTAQNSARNTNDFRPSTVPNATAVLVLGICSIVGCFAWGIPGLICGIIAMSLHKKDKALYLTNPEKYENSFNTSKSGNTCATVGTILSGVGVLLFIIYIVFIVSMVGSATRF